MPSTDTTRVIIDMDAFRIGFAEFERRNAEGPRPKDYAFVYGLAEYLRAAQGLPERAPVVLPGMSPLPPPPIQGDEHG